APGVAFAAGGLRTRLGRTLAGLALGRLLALGTLCLRLQRGEFLLGGLGLDDLRRRGDRGDDHLRVVEKRDALRRAEVGDAQRAADLHARDVEVQVLR